MSKKEKQKLFEKYVSFLHTAGIYYLTKICKYVIPNQKCPKSRLSIKANSPIHFLTGEGKMIETNIFLFISSVFITLHKTIGIPIPLRFPSESIMTSLKQLIFLRTVDKILKFPFI